MRNSRHPRPCNCPDVPWEHVHRLERDSLLRYGHNLCPRSARNRLCYWFRRIHAIHHFYFLCRVSFYFVLIATGLTLFRIYTTILTNRLTATIPAQVPPALVNAGLPASSVAGFLTAFTTANATALQAVSGISPAIIAVGTRAYKFASMDAYRTVFYSTIAFSGIGMIMTLFLPSIDHLMTSEVSTALHSKREGGPEGTVVNSAVHHDEKEYV
jgi:hypothetical protein